MRSFKDFLLEEDYETEEGTLLGKGPHGLNIKVITKDTPNQKWGGYFDCSSMRLSSLKYCPKEINGYFSCSKNQITTLEYAPKKITGVFYCENNSKLTSLKDIHKYIEYLAGIGGFNFQGTPITSHILGLILIDGLTPKTQLEADPGSDLLKAFDIIKPFLGKGRQVVMDAQRELIDAGYPEFAKL